MNPQAASKLSQGEKAEAVAACMRDRGFAAEVIEGGGGTWGVRHGSDPAQAEADEAAYEACDAELGAAGETAYDARFDYDYKLWLAECLRSEGFDIPDPPTYDAWAEAVDDPANWSPYVFVNIDALIRDGQFDSLTYRCPQVAGTGRLDPYQP